MNNLTVIRYLFTPYFTGYFQEGKWYSEKGYPIKEKYYNWRPCIDCHKKRYSIKKLRTFAKRIEVTQQILPF